MPIAGEAIATQKHRKGLIWQWSTSWWRINVVNQHFVGDDLGSWRTSNQWRDAQIRTSSGSTDELESRSSDLIENCWSGQISQCTYCTWSIYGIRCTVIYSLRFTVRPNINVPGTWYKYKPYSETTENSRHYKFIAKAFKIYPKMQNFQLHRSIQDHLEKKHYWRSYV